jgi:hypothetical protein
MLAYHNKKQLLKTNFEKTCSLLPKKTGRCVGTQFDKPGLSPKNLI